MVKIINFTYSEFKEAMTYVYHPTIKKLFPFLLVVLLTTGISMAADSYYVIHLKGAATNKTTGKSIKVGDQVSSSDKIQFGSADAAIILMGAKGKYTLTPSGAGHSNSELVAFVQNSLIPMKSNGHLSTRGGESENVMDLKGYFGTSRFCIIGDRISIPLDPAKYPLTDKKVFILRYIHSDTVVSKKIDYRGNSILINKKSLFTVKGASIDPNQLINVDLYYFNIETRNSTKIVNFIPLFVNEETLKNELMVQKNILKKQRYTQEQIDKELLSFVSDVYGRTDEVAFNRWLKTNINAE